MSVKKGTKETTVFCDRSRSKICVQNTTDDTLLSSTRRRTLIMATSTKRSLSSSSPATPTTLKFPGFPLAFSSKTRHITLILVFVAAIILLFYDLFIIVSAPRHHAAKHGVQSRSEEAFFVPAYAGGGGIPLQRYGTREHEQNAVQLAFLRTYQRYPTLAEQNAYVKLLRYNPYSPHARNPQNRSVHDMQQQVESVIRNSRPYLENVKGVPFAAIGSGNAEARYFSGEGQNPLTVTAKDIPMENMIYHANRVSPGSPAPISTDIKKRSLDAADFKAIQYAYHAVYGRFPPAYFTALMMKEFEEVGKDPKRLEARFRNNIRHNAVEGGELKASSLDTMDCGSGTGNDDGSDGSTVSSENSTAAGTEANRLHELLQENAPVPPQYNASALFSTSIPQSDAQANHLQKAAPVPADNDAAAFFSTSIPHARIECVASHNIPIAFPPDPFPAPKKAGAAEDDYGYIVRERQDQLVDVEKQECA